MTTDIQYRGITANPTDHISPDGDLTICHNLINTDGALHPLHTPTAIAKLPNGWRPLYIHTTATADEAYLILHDGDTDLIALRLPTGWPHTGTIEIRDENDIRPPLAAETIMRPCTLADPERITSLGNILLVHTPDGLRRFILRQGRYYDLGVDNPEIDINFSLFTDPDHDRELHDLLKFDVNIPIPEQGSVYDFVRDNWIDPTADTPDKPTFTTSPDNIDEIEAAYSALLHDTTDAILGGLNKYLAACREKSRFAQPFFIRCALRLFDGSYISHTAPVLLTPCAYTRVGFYRDEFHPDDFHLDKDKHLRGTVTILGQPTVLAFRILNLHNLPDWDTLITHLDIFITPPIYSYDSDSTFTRGPEYAGSGAYDSVTHYARTVTGAVYPGESEHYPRTGFPAPRARLIDYPEGNYPSLMGFLRRFPLQSKEKDLDTRTAEAANYYRIASIPFEDLKDLYMEHPAVLNIPEGTLTALQARPTLPDDPFSHHRRIPTVTQVYNNRLNLADTNLRPYPGYNPITTQQSYTPTSWAERSEVSRQSTVPASEWAERSEVSRQREASEADAPLQHSAEGESPKFTYTRRVLTSITRDGHTLWLDTGETPIPKDAPLRFIFYPDPAATRTVIVDYRIDAVGESTLYALYDLPMRQHDFLNGSYWHLPYADTYRVMHTVGGLAADTLTAENTLSQIETRLTTQATTIPEPNKIHQSDPSDPFHFPLTGTNTIGTGRILALTTASRPMSQGQFGQYPLHALTTQGIWALTLTSTGSWATISPLNTDIPLSTHSHTPTDTSLLYITRRGLTLLAGAQTNILTATIRPTPPAAPFDPATLPAFLSASISVSTPSSSWTERSEVPEQPDALTTIPLTESTRIIYDPTAARVILFTPGASIAWIYNVATSTWSTAPWALDRPLEYPGLPLAVTPAGHILNLSPHTLTRLSSASEASGQTSVLLLTRPLKLGAPDTLKTITTIIHRGPIRPGHLNAILYGSRDLLTWHHVWSSRTHNLRGFSGTPWRYLRIVLFGHLGPDEAITSAAITHTHRLTSRPRL